MWWLSSLLFLAGETATEYPWRPARRPLPTPGLVPAPPLSNKPTRRTQRPSRPSPWYRLTGSLNGLIWAAPLSHRWAAFLSLWLYRSPPMVSDEVLLILDDLESAGVRSWVSGGWGVDALLGHQVRTHRDLDLVVDFGDEPRAVQALGRLGYREHYRVESDRPTFTRTVLKDSGDRVVDLHPVALSDFEANLATGTIGGRTVGCLSVAFQRLAHEGYKRRRWDRIDVGTLRRLS